MRRTVFCLVLAAIALAPAATAGDAEPIADATRLSGEYYWSERDETGALDAVFEPTGDGTWDVTFRFSFRDKPRVYTGTASGSLTDGALEGTVVNDDKKRTFTFAGTFESGSFRGSHAETTAGRERDTGTMTLGR